MLLGKTTFTCHPDVWHWENEEETVCGELFHLIVLKDHLASVFTNL